MDIQTLRKEIKKKEINLGVLSLKTTIERFDLEILKTQAELERLNEEKTRSQLALDEKLLELEKILKE